jgi:hypothetical protein
MLQARILPWLLSNHYGRRVPCRLTPMQSDASPENSPKCDRCSMIILDGELALRDQGVWFHVRCARILASEERIRKSLTRTRTSQESVEVSQERIERTNPYGEPPAVVCVVCGDGIATAQDLKIGKSGPAHAHCCPPA